MTLKNEINENGLDLGIMVVWMVHVDARDRVISMIEAHGFYGKLPKSVKDRPSSVPLLRPHRTTTCPVWAGPG